MLGLTFLRTRDRCVPHTLRVRRRNQRSIKMNELEMLNYIRDFKVVVTESVKENICEILNLNKTNEKNLDVSINVRGDIEVRSFGYKFFSVSKDIDDSTKYNSRFFLPSIAYNRKHNRTRNKEI